MSQQSELKTLKMFTQDGNEVLQIYSFTREGGDIIMDCKVLDAMRMDVVVTSDEVFSNFGMLMKAFIPYALLLLWISLKRLFKPLPKKTK
jgi:hypothetical protein